MPSYPSTMSPGIILRMEKHTFILGSSVYERAVFRVTTPTGSCSEGSSVKRHRTAIEPIEPAGHVVSFALLNFWLVLFWHISYSVCTAGSFR